MSDTTQPSALPPSAPAAPAPMQAEVPVNEAPVSQPQPIGDQAPPKPPGQDSNKSSQVSRREAIQNAFARSKQAQEEAAKEVPKRAKPGMGHNQPPEPMEKAQEAKKPAEKPTAAEAAQRYREGGKFARDPAKAAESQPRSTENGREVPSDVGQLPKPLDKSAPYREPPGRFADSAKTEWHATPEMVRGAVHQMAREFHGAYEKLRGDHEVMEELRPYHDLATKQGTSLRRAFDNYYAMETEAARRPDRRAGHDRAEPAPARRGRQAGHAADIAHHVVTMTPEQHQLTVQRNQQTSAEIQRIGQLHQQVEQLSQGMEQLLYQQRYAGTAAQVEPVRRGSTRALTS